MRGEIVSVGTELLLGMIVDTNAQYLAQQLADLGIDVFWVSQVGDNLGRAVEVLDRGLSRSDVTVVTGGLGPTEDDLTREAIGAALGETLTVDPELEQWLRDTFARRGRPMPERNMKQATLIPSARALPNPVGTAPGWWVERDGKIIVAMPGVPTEMRLMWDQRVRPALHTRAGAGILVTTNLKVLGLGEGAVEEQLGDLVHSTNPTVATYAKPDGVQVRISAKASDETIAREMLAPMAQKVLEVLEPWVYGRDEETLASLAAQRLAARGWTLTSAERGTAGALAMEIGTDSTLAEQFRGGFVVAADGTPLGVGSLDPLDLAGAARNQTGAEVAVAMVLSSEDGRPVAKFAANAAGHVQTGSSRWNLAIPELRRRAAVETLALLLRALREAT
ncbi:MAG: CinA family nicotinamide mononucleotide deamidase-related protein [Chloroflexi bacterium]|nr:CinA family nicotinamide mononucleotide deamidase-related protein [Chloroflexota bacterium]